ncbi:MAG: hypothetical protein K2X99_01470 [Gemmatimonadaceae bacterium]|nr:hypothetical protein [Gemmatimonadaceae bacterium]
MSDRNWDAEMKKIDRAMESVSDEALFPAKGAASAPQRAAALEAQKTTSTWGVFARLTLSVALGVGMALWPYASRCGFGLAGYLAAVGVLVASGVWSAVWTWRHRAAKAHILSLLLMGWGIVLGAQEVLPRVGYAFPSTAHPAQWSCTP